MIYKAYIRPQIEFANLACFPYRSKDINTLEKVQKRAKRIVQNLKRLPYAVRCNCLELNSLIERWTGFDMIQHYQIIKELENINWIAIPAVFDPRGGQRGHMRRKILRACDQRRYFVNNRNLEEFMELATRSGREL